MDSFSWGHDPFTLACEDRPSFDGCGTFLSVSDILWSVNKLARSITKWTKACDKRLSRLISYIHHTCEFKQYCHVGNTAKQCNAGWDYFKILILPVTWRIRNQHRAEACAFLEVTRSCQ